MDELNMMVGDVIRLKKKHPCGSFEWKITRVGMDIGIKCMGCEHFLLIPRTKLKKMIKSMPRS